MCILNDIQIFIPTYNRAEYLKHSLLSLINQTAGVPNITVFNNASTDNTSEIIKEFEQYGVKEYKSKGNLLDCMNIVAENMLSDTKYVMFFHDDDILHPKYLEYSLNVLNTYPNIAYITTKHKNFPSEESYKISKNVKESHYLFESQKDFATYMYLFEGVAMQPTLYRVDLFKSIPRKPEDFGKFFDWPYLVELAKYGNTVLFQDENMFMVRVHKKQWTWDKNTGLSMEQLINWDKCFFEAMEASKKYSLGFLAFYCKYLRFLHGKYQAFCNADCKAEYTFEDVKHYAYDKFGMNYYYSLSDNVTILELMQRFLFSKCLYSKIGENKPFNRDEENEDIIFFILIEALNKIKVLENKSNKKMNFNIRQLTKSLCDKVLRIEICEHAIFFHCFSLFKTRIRLKKKLS